MPESRRYALFRTWAAPEMPRPGCVWSHVLLLGPKISASIPALSEVLPFFRRPTANDTSSYGDPLDISFSQFAEPASGHLILEIISSYYTVGRATLSPDSGDDIENAVLAVWSQQWPRLRSSFSFCTASLNENRRTEQSDYNVQVAPLDEATSISRERWVSYAAADAALNKVTPLRRFLWRYGRDISAPRRQYQMIVDLYLRSDGADVLSSDAAFEVFRALPDPSDGAVLKRDILGIGPRLAAPRRRDFRCRSAAAPDFGGASRNPYACSGWSQARGIVFAADRLRRLLLRGEQGSSVGMEGENPRSYCGAGRQVVHHDGIPERHDR